MTVEERLLTDLKEAMRSGDKLRVNVIRSARAALQAAQLETAKQQYDAAVQDIETRLADDPAARDAAMTTISADYHASLDPVDQEAVIAREIKRRRDSAAAYHQANRIDLAETEEAEARILEEYLPQQLSADELRPQIMAVIDELRLQGPADMGKLMPVLMERFRGRAEGRMLSQLARELLASR